jgi:hypothetical protein
MEEEIAKVERRWKRCRLVSEHGETMVMTRSEYDALLAALERLAQGRSREHSKRRVMAKRFAGAGEGVN